MLAQPLTLYTPDIWGWVERSDIEIVQINVFLLKHNDTQNIVDRPLIPKVNLGVGEMGLMFCDLHVSLK